MTFFEIAEVLQMIYIIGGVTAAFLFVYLIYALINPERF